MVKHTMADELVWRQLEDQLSQGQFATADELYRSQQSISETEYIDQKTVFLVQYVRRKYDPDVTEEQVRALANPAKHVLVRARAGSGKTRVLAHKAALVIEQEKLRPDQVLILSFNKNAVAEIRRRVENVLSVDEFATAKTFHSFANEIARATGFVLGDVQTIAKCLESAITDCWDDEFYENALKFGQSVSPSDLVNLEQILEQSDTLEFRRNQRDITLDNKRVKSLGEKYIADFLVEHGILYDYEPILDGNGKNYRPDFCIHANTGSRKIYLEHWGIRVQDPEAETPHWWSTTAIEYRKEIAWKRNFCQKHGLTLCETSEEDLLNGKEAFEQRLAAILTSHGIAVNRLPEKTIREKIRRMQGDHLTRKIRQFVQYAKQRSWSPAHVAFLLSNRRESDPRTRAFWSMALRGYQAYETELQRKKIVDFDGLLIEIAGTIEKIGPTFQFATHQKAKRSIALGDLRWLLIDEFQDFTPAFARLVSALIETNPSLRVFAVGDDWQAINGFAGADLHYFHNFGDLFPGAAISELLTNHRSKRLLIDVANDVMHGEGSRAKPKPSAEAGDVHVYTIDGTKLKRSAEADLSNQNDARYQRNDKRYDRGFLWARGLKTCHILITSERHLDKKIAVLSRRNSVYGGSLLEFEKQLKSYLPAALRKQVTVTTIHKYKGQEADVVILLEVVDGNFPLITQEIDLFAPFFPDSRYLAQRALKEERRVYYVAVTRAKDALCILTESDQMSPYIKLVKERDELMKRPRSKGGDIQ